MYILFNGIMKMISLSYPADVFQRDYIHSAETRTYIYIMGSFWEAFTIENIFFFFLIFFILLTELQSNLYI